MSMIGPIWISPLFNDFGPMQDKALEAEILALADRAGIEGSRVFEVNKSVDTEAVNAYVTGFLNTKRIVLWDTILSKLDSGELLFVMAHEMGHYVLGHVVRSTFVISGLILAGLYFVFRISGALIDRYRDRFGFDSLGDFASLPLIMLLMSLFMFVLTPVMMTYSRHQEHEADRFGLELTRDNHNAATAFVKLQQENLGNPRPGLLYKLWRAGHPTLGDRIDFCNEYRPWEAGEALRYGSLFRNP
jgi:Zn-dependent protease with chaperone function